VTVNPLSAVCPLCRSEVRFRCLKSSGVPAGKPHKRRVKLALALAAHADPLLDASFPRVGPCGFCGPQFDQRHRVIDAIAGRLEGGEGREEAAGDYGLPVAAVDVIAAWAKRWPGAWG
jgi:hypothetical protein